ncbi:MAG: flagellar hook-basal body complex protein FliE [Aureliella sp.]
MLPIQSINPAGGLGSAQELLPAKEAGSPALGMFEKLLKQANQDQLKSDEAVKDLVTGKTDNVQQVVMQVVKAEMSFQMFMEVRNQLIESYNELMRMQF